MFIDIITGQYPLTEADIRAQFPNVIFSTPFEPPPAFARVEDTPHPEWNPVIERVVEDAPEFVGGAWRKAWRIEKLFSTTEEEAAALAAHEAMALQQWREQTTCTPFQGKVALFNVGLLDDIEALVAGTTVDTVTKLAWANALEWRRTSPMIASLAAALGMTDTQVDDLFKAAQTIEA